MRRPLRLWFAVFLAGCGESNQVACTNPAAGESQDCATVSSATWRIGPYPTSSESEVRVEVGGSRDLFLDPFVESQCAETVVSVAWSVDDASIATVVPKDRAYRGSWVNGLVPGTTGVRARIAFSDGTQQETAPRVIQVVVTAPAEGSVVVAEGTVDLEPYNGNSAADSRRYVPFTLPRAASRVEVTVNWTSPLNGVGFAFFQGECSGPASASCYAGLRFIQAPTVSGVKPVALSLRDLPADIYTVRIDNLGPGRETARYEVRVTPS